MKTLALLSRTTTSGRFIAEIDGLRFIAIFSVILYHAFLYARCSYGVQLFFAISGFILGLPFAAAYLQNGPRVFLKKYFLRRLTRLEPPYLLSLAATFAFGLLVSHKLEWSAHLPSFWASTLYLHNLIYGHESYISTVAWSLEVEVQFYCLVPLLTALFLVPGRWARRTVISGTMLAAGLAQTYLRPPHVIGLTILGQLQFFLAGFILVDVYLIDWKQSPKKSWFWDFVWLGSVPMLFFASSNRPLVNTVFPFATALFYCATFRGRMASSLFSSPALTIPGGMCYTIYLYHSQIMSVVKRILPKSYTPPMLFPVQLVAVFIICIALFLLIEKPCMNPNWPKQLFWLFSKNNKAKAMAQSA